MRRDAQTGDMLQGVTLTPKSELLCPGIQAIRPQAANSASFRGKARSGLVCRNVAEVEAAETKLWGKSACCVRMSAVVWTAMTVVCGIFRMSLPSGVSQRLPFDYVSE